MNRRQQAFSSSFSVQRSVQWLVTVHGCQFDAKAESGIDNRPAVARILRQPVPPPSAVEPFSPEVKKMNNRSFLLLSLTAVVFAPALGARAQEAAPSPVFTRPRV